METVNFWQIAGSVGSVVTVVGAALALYLKLTVKGALADFLATLTVTLDNTYARKSILDAVKDAERHSAVIEAARVGSLEIKTDGRLTALENIRRGAQYPA